MHFERHLPLKMYTIIFFLKTNYQKRKICVLPYLKLSDLLPEHTLILLFLPSHSIARVNSKILIQSMRKYRCFLIHFSSNIEH